jgi:hypothetical protein
MEETFSDPVLVKTRVVSKRHRGKDPPPLPWFRIMDILHPHHVSSSDLVGEKGTRHTKIIIDWCGSSSTVEKHEQPRTSGGGGFTFFFIVVWWVDER